MIDRSVENGQFFHPRDRMVIVGDDIKFIYPVRGAEIDAVYGFTPKDFLMPKQWDRIQHNLEDEFTRQVKIKLGISKESDYI